MYNIAIVKKLIFYLRTKNYKFVGFAFVICISIKQRMKLTENENKIKL